MLSSYTHFVANFTLFIIIASILNSFSKMKPKCISEYETRRKRVYEFFLEHRSKGKTFTVEHFQAEKMPKRTIYRIIEQAENESGHKRAEGSGRPPVIMTKTNIKRLKASFDHKDTISQRQAARKFQCSQQFISQTLKNKSSIITRKKMKIPKRTDEQKAKIRPRCRRLLEKLRGKCCVMDDESYFTLSHSHINGNGIFYTSDVSATPANVKYAPTAKYEKKLLVWLCFSERGISKPFFLPSGMAINQHVYLSECIQKRLMPFIAEHHSDNSYIFWPDLASSHYAKSVISYLEDKKVNFVQKEDNPPNVPELRPIENLWSILKGKVYAKNWQAKSLEDLRKKVEQCLKEVDMTLVQRLARQVPSLVDSVRRHGLFEDQ